MNTHLNTHLLDMAQLLKTAVSSIETLKAEVQETNSVVAKLSKKLKESEREKTVLQERVSQLEESVKNLKTTKSEKTYDREISLGKETRNGTELNLLLPLSSSAVRNGTHSSLTAWESDRERHGRAESGMREELSSHETQLMKMSETLHTVQNTLTQNTIAIDEVRLRQDILDVKVTNGLLIWKIPDLRRRYRDAVDRRTISLYSPPFFTSPHGYRMCIRAYLNGDGIGKGTHVSLFFVVMCSEHDNLLPWPFKQSVRFTLINQKNPPASITEAFMPDVNSSSFQKPQSDMNVASGFPKFAKLSVLDDEEFTMGNLIYIKCQVNTAGLKLE